MTSLELFYFINFFIIHTFIHSLPEYLPLRGAFPVNHATRALQTHDLSGEGINFGSHAYFFWPHKDMVGLPGWGISSMPGLPPRQHEHERPIHIIHALIHSNIMNMKGWVGRPNDIRGPCGPKASWHLSYRWEKTPKKPHQGNLSWPEIEPGPAAWQARMLPPATQRWTFFISNVW